jgi:chromosome segregation ATPase
MEEYRVKASLKHSENFSGIERRVEKIEKFMNIFDEITLLKKDQEESKQFEVDRRLDALDNRLRRIEQAISNFVLDLNDKLESHDNQIGLLRQIPILKSDLEDLKCSFYTDERLAALEKELNMKMLKMFETIEDLTRSVTQKEKEIERLKREVAELRNENEKFCSEREVNSGRVKELVNQMEEIWRRQEMIDSQNSRQRQDDESLDEEELFLKRLRASGYTFK